ncbi:MAG: 30S ribosome-binding factor RbfA [Chloroflexi bacterium]|nr:30S ribosome-binding factor RbfA [Chloroflexota bacterium]
MSGHRAERLSQLILQEVSVMLDREIHDPRVVGARVLHVQVSGDLRVAKIYINATGYTKDEIADMLDGLAHASRYIRRQLAVGLDLRIAPELRFFADHSIAQGEHFLQVLDQVQAENRAGEKNARKPAPQ